MGITDGDWVCSLCGEPLTGCGLCGQAPNLIYSPPKPKDQPRWRDKQ